MHDWTSLRLLPRWDILLRDEIEEDLVVKLLLLLCVRIEEPVVEILICFIFPKADESANIESCVSIGVLTNKLSIVGEHLKEDAVKLVPNLVDPVHGHELVSVLILLIDNTFDILGQLTEQFLWQLKLMHPFLLLVVPYACAWVLKHDSWRCELISLITKISSVYAMLGWMYILTVFVESL